MKCFFVIPVMFIYLIAISGMMIQLHYCGQELESWSVFLDKEGCVGGECGDESQTNDGCCKDKVIASKTLNDQNSVSFIKLKIASAEWQPVLGITYTATYNIPLLSQRSVNDNRANAPPGLWQQIPLYKLHSRLTYYG